MVNNRFGSTRACLFEGLICLNRNIYSQFGIHPCVVVLTNIMNPLVVVLTILVVVLTIVMNPHTVVFNMIKKEN